MIAAVNVSSHASRTTIDQLQRAILPILLAAGERIEKDLTAAPADHYRHPSISR